MQTLCQLLVLIAVLTSSATALAVVLGIVKSEQVTNQVKKLVLIAVCLWLLWWAASCLIQQYLAALLRELWITTEKIALWLLAIAIIVGVAGLVLRLANRKSTQQEKWRAK